MRFPSVGVRFGFELLTNKGKAVVPTDAQVDAILSLPKASEVNWNPVFPVNVIFYVEEEEYTPEFVAECKRKVGEILAHRRKEYK